MSSKFSLLSRFDRFVAQITKQVKSPLEKKRVAIAFNLALMQIAITLGLFIFSTSIGNNAPTTFYAPTASLITMLAVFVAYKGHYKIAITIGLLSINLFMFFLSLRAGKESGVDHYFVATSCAAFVLFGYEDRKIAIGLACLSFVLFTVVRMVDVTFIEPIFFAPDQAFLFLIINSALTFFLSLYCIVMVLKLSYESEKGLLEKQQQTEMQNEELKKTNQELDRFVYSASHDLSAPLKSVLGLIAVTKLENPSPSIARYLNMMKQSVDKLDSFILDIINYSRNSRLPMKLDRIDFTALIKSIWKNHEYSSLSGTIQFQVQNHLTSNFYSDEIRLKIIFNNLISNAIKFHCPERRENPFIAVVAREEPNHFEFSVEDNGQGIQSDNMEDIFKMFFRANDSVQGSGLGLYILKETLDKLNGQVTVKSKPGEGTLFTIVHPKKLVNQNV